MSYRKRKTAYISFSTILEALKFIGIIIFNVLILIVNNHKKVLLDEAIIVSLVNFFIKY